MMPLQELSLKAVPNPGEQARKVLPPWHMVRIAVEERDFSEMRQVQRGTQTSFSVRTH